MDESLEEIEKQTMDGVVDQALVDKAVENRLLLRLRKAAYYLPNGRKAAKVSIIGKNLTDAQLLEIWGQLSHAKKTGTPVYDELARKIQEDWKQLKNYSRWAVSRSLQYYEQRIFGLLGVAESIPELKEWSNAKLAAVRKIVKRVDGLETLSDAIHLQMNRIEMAIDLEQKPKKPKLTPFLNKEFDILTKMVKTYMEYQLEFGVVSRQPHKLQVGMLQEGFNKQTRQIEQTVGLDPMIQATTRFLDILRNKKPDECLELPPPDEEIIEAEVEEPEAS